MEMIFVILAGIFIGVIVNGYNNFESLKKNKFKNCLELFYKKIEYILINVLITGIVILFYIKFGFVSEYVTMAVLAVILITASIKDIKTKKIPNNIIVFGLLVGTILILINIKDTNYMFNSGLGLVVPLVVLGAISYISKGALGMGDVKLFAVTGIIAGLPLILSSLFLSSILAFIAGMIILFLKKGTKKTEFAFAPFIAAGIILTIFMT